MMRTSEIFRENRNLPFMKPDSGEDDLVDIKALKNVLANRDSQGESFHVSPYSTLIACVGNNWSPGCYEAVMEMSQATAAAGVMNTVYEIPDLCYNRGDALGTMRNEAYMKARLEGYEYILYLDNDVEPATDLLINLIGRGLPVIVPIPEYHVAPEEMKLIDDALSIHTKLRGRGLEVIRSSVISCLLMGTSVFNPWYTGNFWSDAYGAHEEFHFDRLRTATGHRLYLDTDQVVKVHKAPHFPLDNRGLATPF